jgi:hypothetical protein
MESYFNVLAALYCLIFLSSCSTNTPKSTSLMSFSKEESMKDKFYIGEFDLVRSNGKCEDIKKVNCWGESAWKSDNTLLIPKKRQLDFYNFFLKLNNESCTKDYAVQYKQRMVDNWQSTSCVLEPNFGYYLQISKNTSLDSIVIKISSRVDTCIYKVARSQ